MATKGKKPVQANRALKANDNLPDDMIADIRDCFNFYDTERRSEINRNQFKSILGNFSHYNLTAKEIEEEVAREFDPSKNNFYFDDLISTISKRWFASARDLEAREMYNIFDTRKREGVGLNDVKSVFNMYLDVNIADADIMEFIEDADLDRDGVLNLREFSQKYFKTIYFG